MNKQRKQELRELINEINKAKDQDDIIACANTLEYLKDEEEEYYNNAPGNLQYSWRYQMSEEAIESMNDALDCLEDAQSCEDEREIREHLENAVSNIEKTLF